MKRRLDCKLGEELEDILIEEFGIDTSINFDEYGIYIQNIIENDSVNEFMYENKIDIYEIEEYVLYKINIMGWN